MGQPTDVPWAVDAARGRKSARGQRQQARRDTHSPSLTNQSVSHSLTPHAHSAPREAKFARECARFVWVWGSGVAKTATLGSVRRARARGAGEEGHEIEARLIEA